MTADERHMLRAEVDRAIRARHRLPGRDGAPIPTGREHEVLGLLKQAPATTGQVYKGVGGSHRAIRVALHNLREQGTVRLVGRGASIRWTAT